MFQSRSVVGVARIEVVARGKSDRHVLARLASSSWSQRLAIVLVIFFHHFYSPSLAAGACPAGPLVLGTGETLVIWEDCDIGGGITMSGNALLIVSDSSLIVRGDILLNDQAVMYVQRATLSVDNEHNLHHEIRTLGSSTLWLHETAFRSRLSGQGSFVMAHFSEDQATTIYSSSSAHVDSGWLISRMGGQSKLLSVASTLLPSEVVLSEQATVRLQDNVDTAAWLEMPAGARALMFLPDQTAGTYSYRFGRNTAGVEGIDYDIQIVDSNARLHLGSSPASQLVVVGRGDGPGLDGEISIGYVISGAADPETISGLRPGYQFFTHLTHQARNLYLINVDVDPVGWNIYVSANPAPVTISDSVLNEVAAYPGGQVEVEDSVLQWAVLGSLGLGSSLVVRDSHIFSLAVHADGDGRIEVRDSFVHGSALEALDDSQVRVVGGLLLPNGNQDPCDFEEGLAGPGIPLCNPFLQPGEVPQIVTADNGEVLIEGSPPPLLTDLHLVGWGDPEQISGPELFTYTVQTGNAGPDDATGVTVVFKTPPQAVVDSFSPECTQVGSDVTCTVGDLPVFVGSDLLSVTYQVVSPTSPILGDITVSGNEADPTPSNHHLRLTTTVLP